MNKVITIGREFGSGGRELGRRIAEALQIDYYDKEILAEIAKHTSMSEEYVQQIMDGKHPQLFPITIGQTFMLTADYHIQQMQSIYGAQSDIIRDLANRSSCVIVGRCANYILRDMNPRRLFVYADIESRVKRCIERNKSAEDLTEKEIRKHILRIDKDRARFYSDYTGQAWGDRLNYDYCINTTNVVIKDIAPIIAQLVNS